MLLPRPGNCKPRYVEHRSMKLSLAATRTWDWIDMVLVSFGESSLSCGKRMNEACFMWALHNFRLIFGTHQTHSLLAPTGVGVSSFSSNFTFKLITGRHEVFQQAQLSLLFQKVNFVVSFLLVQLSCLLPHMLLDQAQSHFPPSRFIILDHHRETHAQS